MKLEALLQSFERFKGDEMRLEPNLQPYFVTPDGRKNASYLNLNAATINSIIFPIIPGAQKTQLPNQAEIEFDFVGENGKFRFTVGKSSAGFTVTIRKSGAAAAPNNAPQVVENNKPLAAPRPIPREALPNNNPVAAPKQSNVSDLRQFQPDNAIQTAKIQTSAAIFDEPEEFAFEPVNANPPFGENSRQFANRAAPTETSNFEQQAVEINGAAKQKMDALFRQMAEVKASDLHLSVSMPPMMRHDGRMKPLDNSHEKLTADAMRELLRSIMPEKNRVEFERRRDTDFTYEIADLARFRANIFMDRKGMGGVFRIIPTKILTAEQLGLSQPILDLCNLSKGLVVVTGPTGSGKSTTLCAMIDYINKTRDEHLITIEDPIEFVHENQKCLINQREVHNHTDSFKDALRAALREDPDILLVGEMRDLETIAIAIETAETGHLVFGTLHTTTAPSTVDRIIDQFPADRQQQIRVMLSESLKGVIAQTLLPKKGGGRVAAMEILIVTPAISNLIREGKTFQIASSMQTGKQHGMVILNDALLDYVKKGIVEPRDAYLKAVDKIGFEAGLKRLNLSL